MTEISRGASDIVDKALETRLPGKKLSFFQNRLFAPGGNDASLMERERTEIAGPKAAPFRNDGKFHFFQGRYAALAVIGWMPFSGERKGNWADKNRIALWPVYPHEASLILLNAGC